MTLPSEPIGSIPPRQNSRPACMRRLPATISPEELDVLFDDAVEGETLAAVRGHGLARCHGRRAAQVRASRPTRWQGLAALASGGVAIPFEDGHSRELPILIDGPVSVRHASRGRTLDGVRGGKTAAQLKQAVISASAISLMYPADGYRRATRARRSSTTCVAEATSRDPGLHRARRSLGPDRLHRRHAWSLKLDPSGGLLDCGSVQLNNRVSRPASPRTTGARRWACTPAPAVQRGLDAQRRHRLRGLLLPGLYSSWNCGTGFRPAR